jgi:hydroxymethylglutaryl-CoA reductase
MITFSGSVIVAVLVLGTVVMSDLNEEILKELRQQSKLLESIEKIHNETNGHLKVVGTLIVVVGSLLFLARIFQW